jgi:hypothetical protein
VRQCSVLNILVYEKKVLREEDLLHLVVDEHGVGMVDLRGYDVPEEVKKGIDLDACWATWSVPFDREEDFHFVATAYYLSPAVRTFWEKSLGGQIIWQATTLDIIADFLDRIQVERRDSAKPKGTTKSPFGGGSRSPIPVPGGMSGPPSTGSTHIPFPPSVFSKPATPP